ncbi:hypothetical protein LN042_06620 [Kitasatospora sp. RB6PN24]|nr:hypothetical protein [Kitasatospora humi]MCC9306782.1 hypothetical protein [Kitasatospora humi]
MSETSGTPGTEGLQSGDLENFVLLLDGLKESLAQDRQEGEDGWSG